MIAPHCLIRVYWHTIDHCTPFPYYRIWNVAEAAFIGGLVGRANIINVNAAFPCGMRKVTVPLPVD